MSIKTLLTGIATTAIASIYILTQNSAEPQLQQQPSIQYSQDGHAINPLLSDWMGTLLPVIGSQNYFDISSPGTHDTLTYDLSEIFADRGNSIPLQLTFIMHNFVSNLFTFGNFGKTQARTQSLSVTDQLNNGIRWIDFRAVYTQDGVRSLTQNWYSLHFMQTNQKLIDLSKEIKDWVDAHPNEIVTIQMSFHGDSCAREEDAYPGTTNAQKQKFWKQFEELFEDVLYNSDKQKPLNELSVQDMIDQNSRVVAYVSNWKDFTDSSPYAQNGCQCVQNGGSGIDTEEEAYQTEIDFFKQVSQQKAKTKSKNQFLVKSMVTSEQGENILSAFMDRYIPDDQLEELQDLAYTTCTNIYDIPDNKFCPAILYDLGQWTNYYKQLTISMANQNKWEFPNAMFVDQLDWDGTIRTGTNSNISEVDESGQMTTENARFAYSPIIIMSNLYQACGENPSTQCQALISTYDGLIKKYPVKTWDDLSYGRVSNWPTEQ